MQILVGFIYPTFQRLLTMAFKCIIKVPLCTLILLLIAMATSLYGAHSNGGSADELESLESYKLKIGDELQLSLYGEPDSVRRVTINWEGKISYINAHEIEVRGKTIAELRSLLQEKLSSYYREPTLLIMPMLFGSEFYTIMGEVRNPGLKRFVGIPTILTALCEGGGFTMRIFRNQTIDQTDLNHSFLSRKGTYIPVDFNALLNEGDMSQDRPLKPGDYVYMAAKTIPRVYVLGEVNAPSTVTFFDSISLAESIAEAGGTTRFASSRVAVIRGSLYCPERYLIDFNRIVKGNAIDFPLEAGDIVYVPSMQYTTLKEVVRAGIASFVSIVFSSAGTNAFIAIQPHAAVSGIISPAPFINNNAGVTSPTAAGASP